MCCSVLQCVADMILFTCEVWWIVLQSAAEIVLQCVAVCSSALQCVAVRCSALQCVAVCYRDRVAACCSIHALQPKRQILVYDCVGQKKCASVAIVPNNNCGFNIFHMGWLRLVGSLKVKVSNAKEPYKRDDILRKRPMILRSLLMVATP